MTKRPTSNPVTVGQLRHRGHGLELHCLDCARSSTLNRTALLDLKLSDHIAVQNAGRYFRCARCKGCNIEARPSYHPVGELGHSPSR